MDSLVLKATETWSPLYSNPLEIRSSIGMLWITEEGASQDIILRTGESFKFTGNGKVVVQAITDATLEVEMKKTIRGNLLKFPFFFRFDFGPGLPVPPGKGRRSLLSSR